MSDRYRLLKLLGQGSFGRTYLAVDESQPGKPRCAIKQFFPQSLGSGEQAAELFRQEAQRLEELGHHPQIPALLDYFEADGNQYIVQEYIDGTDLATLLSADGPWKEVEIRQLLIYLLPVLEFIHAHQVIHRDIKPQNIIRRSDGQLFLVDFGAAKYATGTALAKTGTMIGTAAYTASEQLMGKAVYASDLFSLGVTCIHLLTQMEPFDLMDLHEGGWIWRDYLTQPVSSQLAQVLDRMLERYTSKRYQSADAVLQALDTSPLKNSSTTINSNSQGLLEQALAKPTRFKLFVQVLLDMGTICVLGASLLFGYQLAVQQAPSILASVEVLILKSLNPSLQPAAASGFFWLQIFYIGYLTRAAIKIFNLYQQDEDWMNEARPFMLVLIAGFLLDIVCAMMVI